MPIIINPPFKTLDSGLVLYAPLWAGELSVSPFNSKDINKHVCTATGALWTPQGRTFDGVDDKIQTGATVAFNTNNIYTAIAWIYPTDYKVNGDPNCFLSFGTNTPTSGYMDEFSLRWSAPNLNVRFANYAGDWTGVGGVAPVNTWSCVVLVHDGVNDKVKIYVNGALGLDVAYTFDLLTTTGVVTVGCENLTVPEMFFTGGIGEVLVYKRELNPLEIQHNYLATRWRYQ